jgi:leucine-zipper of insertion element IS481
MLAGDRLQVDPAVRGRGVHGLHDRSSRPHRSPARLSARRKAAFRPGARPRWRARIGSPRPSERSLPPCTECSAAWGHHACGTSTGQRAGLCAMSGIDPASSSTWTSRSKEGSPKGEGGGSTAGRAERAPGVIGVTATISSTLRSMTARAWSTPRSCPTSAGIRPRSSSPGRLGSSPSEACTSSECSSTTAGATAPASSPRRWLGQRSHTDGRGHIGPRPTARSSGST